MHRARALLLAFVSCLLVAGPAAAAKPEMERVPINDIGILDEFLTDACGFDVFLDATGHIIFRVYTDAEGNPTREVNNFGVRLIWYSEWGSVSAVDVGVDRVTLHPDGSLTISVTGSVQSPITLPGQGVLAADIGITTIHITFPDPEGEPVVEVVHEAGLHFGDQAAAICEALAP
jgi:hypothetical protein